MLRNIENVYNLFSHHFYFKDLKTLEPVYYYLTSVYALSKKQVETESLSV